MTFLPAAFVALFPSKAVARVVAVVLAAALAYYLWTRLRTEVRAAAQYRPRLTKAEERRLGKPHEFYAKFAAELHDALAGIFDWPPTKQRLVNQLNAMTDDEIAWVAHVFNAEHAGEAESLRSFIEAEWSLPSSLRAAVVARLSAVAQNTEFAT